MILLLALLGFIVYKVGMAWKQVVTEEKSEKSGIPWLAAGYFVGSHMNPSSGGGGRRHRGGGGGGGD
jgi:hypothetical protein